MCAVVRIFRIASHLFVLSQMVLNHTLPKILLADTIAFPDKLNFTADLINPRMVRKALRYLAAGNETVTITPTQTQTPTPTPPYPYP
jgi:hypothetical protein